MCKRILILKACGNSDEPHECNGIDNNGMEPRKDHRIDQCLNDIQKYEEWGNLLVGQSWVYLFKKIRRRSNNYQ